MGAPRPLDFFERFRQNGVYTQPAIFYMNQAALRFLGAVSSVATDSITSIFIIIGQTRMGAKEFFD